MVTPKCQFEQLISCFKGGVLKVTEDEGSLNQELEEKPQKDKPKVAVVLFSIFYILLGLALLFNGADPDSKFYLFDDILVRFIGLMLIISSIGLLYKKEIARKVIIVTLLLAIIEVFIAIQNEFILVGIIISIFYIPGLVYFSVFANKTINNMKKDEEIGCLPFLFGGFSFIPLLGVVFGIITIVLGVIYLKQRGWRLIVLGLSGILFTVVLYGSLYYFGFVHRGGVFDEHKTQLVELNLNQIIQSVEYFKIQNDRYPHSLSELDSSSNTPLVIIDLLSDELEDSREYYYEVIEEGKKYYLFSSGFDRIPFTDDDILPDLTEEEIKRIGYKVRPTTR
jgi:hypothetical protein